MSGLFLFVDLVPGIDKRIVGNCHKPTNDAVEVVAVLELTGANVRLCQANSKFKQLFRIHSIVSSWPLRGVMTGTGQRAAAGRYRNLSRVDAAEAGA